MTPPAPVTYKPRNYNLLGKLAWVRDYLEALHRVCDIEHVHSVDNDGWRSEEEEKDEQADIKQNKSHPPRCAMD